jgi:phosphate butyryltransferase
MSLPSFSLLHEQADALASPVPIAVVGAADRTVLESMRVGCDRGWIAPTLVGSRSAIRRLAEEAGIGLEGFAILDVEGAEQQAFAALAEIRGGRARLLAKGQVQTPTLMNAVLDPEFGLRRSRVVSQVVLMEIVDQRRRFLMADTGINVKPRLASRVEILQQTIEVARALGVARSRIALMAASESVNTSMPETVEAAEIQRRNREGEFPGASIQGPLSFDLAYSSDAGGKKRIDGEVVGSADAMVFPDLLSANLTVKAIMYTADCQFGGVLRGTTAPVAFMSRSDTAATRLNSLALALAIFEEEQGPRHHR